MTTPTDNARLVVLEFDSTGTPRWVDPVTGAETPRGDPDRPTYATWGDVKLWWYHIQQQR